MDSEKIEEVDEKHVQFTEDEVEPKPRQVKEHGEKSAKSSDRRDDDKDPTHSNFKRKIGSWIFESVGGYYLPTENVSKLSVKLQEQLLIRDLIALALVSSIKKSPSTL